MTAASSPPPKLAVGLWRGLTGRCPHCGRNGVFHSWFALKEACPSCQHSFQQDSDFWLGAFTINFIVTEGMLAVGLVVGFALTLPDPPIGKMIAIGVPLMIVFPVLFFPISRTLWAAFDDFLRDRRRA